MDNDSRFTLSDSDRRRLVRAAARLLGPAEAEDTVQDAYVRALEADMLFQDGAQPWLVTVGRHLAIDRLRRRRWMQQWLAQERADDPEPASSSAQEVVALAQEAIHALRLIVTRLTPAQGAVVLLHEVFDVGHAEIAQAGGRSDAGSRQQLRRALMRLRQAGREPVGQPHPELDPREEQLLNVYLRSLRLRDPQLLWAMLRQPPIEALAVAPVGASQAAAAPRSTTTGVVNLEGQLSLVVMFEGITLCVLPLGVLDEPDFACRAA